MDSTCPARRRSWMHTLLGPQADPTALSTRRWEITRIRKDRRGLRNGTTC
eukprot:SAG31_NODE_8728_length_1398_cov_1.675135_3_plen_49_part_01